MADQHVHQLSSLAYLGMTVKDRIVHLIMRSPVAELCDSADIAVLKELEKKFPEVDSTMSLPSFSTVKRTAQLQQALDILQDAVVYIYSATEVLQAKSKLLATLQYDRHPSMALPFVEVFNSISECCHLVHRVPLLRGLIAMYKLTSAQNPSFNTRTYFTVHDFVSETTLSFHSLLQKRMPDVRTLCVTILQSCSLWIGYDIAQGILTHHTAWEADFTAPHTLVTSPLYVPFWGLSNEVLQCFVVHTAALFWDLINDNCLSGLLSSVLSNTFVITLHGGEILHPHPVLKQMYRDRKCDKGAKICSETHVIVLRDAPKLFVTRRIVLGKVLHRVRYGMQNNALNIKTKAALILAVFGLVSCEVRFLLRHWGVTPVTKQKLKYHKKEEWTDRASLVSLLVPFIDAALLWSQAAGETATFAEDMLSHLYATSIKDATKALAMRLTTLSQDRAAMLSPCIDSLVSENWGQFTAAHDQLVSCTLDINFLANTPAAASALNSLLGASVPARLVKNNFDSVAGLASLYYFRTILLDCFAESAHFMHGAKLAELFPRAICAEIRPFIEQDAQKFVLSIVNRGIAFTAGCIRTVRNGVEQLFLQVHSGSKPPLPTGEESRTAGPFVDSILGSQAKMALIAEDMQKWHHIYTSASQSVSPLTMFLSQLWVSVAGGDAATMPTDFGAMKTYLDAITDTLFRIALYYPIAYECEILAVMPQIRAACTTYSLTLLDHKKSLFCAPLCATVVGDPVKGVVEIRSSTLFYQMSLLLGVQPALQCIAQAAMQRIEADINSIRIYVEAHSKLLYNTDASIRVVPPGQDGGLILDSVTSMGFVLSVLRILPSEIYTDIMNDIRNVVGQRLSSQTWIHYPGLAICLASMVQHTSFKDPGFKPELRGFRTNAHCVGAALPVLLPQAIERQRFMEAVARSTLDIARIVKKTTVDRATLNNAVMWTSLVCAELEGSPLNAYLPLALQRKCRLVLNNRLAAPSINPFA